MSIGAYNANEMLSEEQHPCFVSEFFAMSTRLGLLYVLLSEGPLFYLQTGSLKRFYVLIFVI